jgi:RHS repeat-associated protein
MRYFDARRNLTSDGTNTFGYSSENLLTSATVGGVATTLVYDPLLRLYQTASGTTARFAYDGLNRIAEYNGADALQRRYVFGPGMDAPIVWYAGATVSSTTRRFLSSDERGSVVSVTNSSGALLGINTYDEYGLPGSSNLGAFGYTGQAWLPSVGVWYYKARIYSPTAGRFLQTDPTGYADSPNLYNYVLGDPVNLSDPLGLQSCEGTSDATVGETCKTQDMSTIFVTGTRLSITIEAPITIEASNFLALNTTFSPTSFGNSLGGGGDRDKQQKKQKNECSGVQKALEQLADQFDTISNDFESATLIGGALTAAAGAGEFFGGLDTPATVVLFEGTAAAAGASTAANGLSSILHSIVRGNTSAFDTFAGKTTISLELAHGLESVPGLGRYAHFLEALTDKAMDLVHEEQDVCR